MKHTRSTVDLTNTSIRDHLLTQTSMSEAKYTIGATNKMSQPAAVMAIDHETSNKIAETTVDGIATAEVNGGKSIPISNVNDHRLTNATEMHNAQQWRDQNLFFSGETSEDAGEWLDATYKIIEQGEWSPTEQRDIAVARLTGEALWWYRLNRLNIPDIQSFIREFLLAYSSPYRHENTTLAPGTEGQRVLGETADDVGKHKFLADSSLTSGSLVRVLQSARNEKVKLFPNFSGNENSSYWLKGLQQMGKALKLDEQHLYELAVIKMSGPAQEWFYLQDGLITDWRSFKNEFLHAFPPPIQPTSIDYLAQLLARKQGETEPVGKYVQDVNRLCLKLGGKMSEQEKLQYLRRGLRPQLQHYALAITSVEDFLTILQRHEQIEKQSTLDFSSGRRMLSKPNYQRDYMSMQQGPREGSYQHGVGAREYQSSKRNEQRNFMNEGASQSIEKENRICYQCNKRGHLQRNCPDNGLSQQPLYEHQQRPYSNQQQDTPEQFQQFSDHPLYQPTQRQQYFHQGGH